MNLAVGLAGLCFTFVGALDADSGTCQPGKEGVAVRNSPTPRGSAPRVLHSQPHPVGGEGARTHPGAPGPSSEGLGVPAAGEEWRDHERGGGRGLRSRGSWRCWGPRHGMGEHRQEVGEGRVSGGSGTDANCRNPSRGVCGVCVGVGTAGAQQGDAGRETVGGEQAGRRPGVSSCTVTSSCSQASSRTLGGLYSGEASGFGGAAPPTPCSHIR